MAIIVKKPSDDPWTWLGPEYTVHHFIETDHENIPGLQTHGLMEDGNTYFDTLRTGNGFFVLGSQGDGTNHKLKYIYLDLTGTSTFVCSFDFAGPAKSDDMPSANQGTFFGIVMKNKATGSLAALGVENFKTYGPCLVFRQYPSEEPGASIGANLYGPHRIDIAETLILKVTRVNSTLTHFYFSTDGVSFIRLSNYLPADSNFANLNSIGCGLDVVEIGAHGAGPNTTAHYPTLYTMSVDWIAYK